MRLRMLTTQKGAEDGHTVREYLADREYEVGGSLRADALARVFLAEGWAEDASAPAAPAPPAAAAEQASRLPVVPTTPIAAEPAPAPAAKRKGR